MLLCSLDSLSHSSNVLPLSLMLGIWFNSFLSLSLRSCSLWLMFSIQSISWTFSLTLILLQFWSICVPVSTIYIKLSHATEDIVIWYYNTIMMCLFDSLIGNCCYFFQFMMMLVFWSMLALCSWFFFFVCLAFPRFIFSLLFLPSMCTVMCTKWPFPTSKDKMKKSASFMKYADVC